MTPALSPFRFSRRRALVAALACLALRTPEARSECMTPTTDDLCPTVHLVHEQSTPGPALNLLVLGDGFLEADLEAYRCAVDRLVERLLEVPPYSTYACRLNVYRMDLASGRDKSGVLVESTCDDDTCVPALPTVYSRWACPAKPSLPSADAPGGDSLTGSRACAVVDLETRLCADGESCHLAGLSVAGEESVALLSTCVTDVDAVLVLANSGDYAGRAVVEANPPFAIATLWDIDVDATWDLVTHELGHALFGLLDEYQSACGTCNFRWFRNIVPGEDLAPGGLIPWQSDCGAPICKRDCTYKPDCKATDSCPADEGGQPCCVPLGSGTPVAGSFVGLVEGGWYRSCGYYRAQKSCKMRSISYPFCAGCEAAVRSQLSARSISACETP